MNMICHQNVSVNPAPTFTFGLSKTFQEETVIVIGEKRGGAIITSLD
jgi:hypothetical protein